MPSTFGLLPLPHFRALAKPRRTAAPDVRAIRCTRPDGVIVIQAGGVVRLELGRLTEQRSRHSLPVLPTVLHDIHVERQAAREDGSAVLASQPAVHSWDRLESRPQAPG